MTPLASQTWTTEGPVQAEVFVVRLAGGVPELTGPCGPTAWYLEVGADEDPLEVVTRFCRKLIGDPLLVHSTSWRRDRGGVLLSFIVVIGEEQATTLEGVPVGRATLARSGATSAPERIDNDQVVEHGLRHLAWLVQDDQEVGRVLPAGWKQILSAYAPEPFRHLGP